MGTQSSRAFDSWLSSSNSPVKSAHPLHRKKRRNAVNNSEQTHSSKKRRINPSENNNNHNNADDNRNTVTDLTEIELNEDPFYVPPAVSDSVDSFEEKINYRTMECAMSEMKGLQSLYNQNKGQLAILKSKNKNVKDNFGKMKQERDTLRDDMDKMTEDMRTLRNKEISLSQKLSLYNGQSEAINALSVKQLNGLEQTFMSTMKRLRESRNNLLELERLCVACKDRPKNVLFVDGCDHIALCVECEQQMTTKKCPIQDCQMPYSITKAIKF